MIPVKFEYYAPKNLDEVFTLLNKYGEDVKVLAGGIDIIRNMRYRVLDHLKCIVSLKNVTGLDFINRDTNGLRIGSMTKLSSLTVSRTVKENCRVLHSVVREIATPPLRNSITIGGNLCQGIKCWHYNLRGITAFMRQAMGVPCWRKDESYTCKARPEDDIFHSIVDIGQYCWASSPSDLAVALSSLNGRITVRGENTERQVPINDFYSVNGNCLLKSDEVVTEVFIPNLPENSSTAYIKDRRGTLDFAVVNIALLVTFDSQEKICGCLKATFGGVAPKPLSVEKTFNLADVDKKIDEIAEELLNNVRINGPHTDYKVNKTKIIIRDAFELAASKGDI